MEIVECLMKAGFTRHESALYVTLCKEGELTGYEASKISGISRSNAYLALAGLVEKGGACRIDSDVIKYIAVPAKELVFNLRNHINETLDFIEKNIPIKAATVDPYITISGKVQSINKMKYIISHAAERIYISTSPYELEYIRKELVQARDRGLKVVLITSKPFYIEGVTIYYSGKLPGQIRLIADTSHVFTGEISDGIDSTCLYSKNGNLIQLIKDSLTNEIKLIQMQPNS